jgi:hypothetical protein
MQLLENSLKVSAERPHLPVVDLKIWTHFVRRWVKKAYLIANGSYGIDRLMGTVREPYPANWVVWR